MCDYITFEGTGKEKKCHRWQCTHPGSCHTFNGWGMGNIPSRHGKTVSRDSGCLVAKYIQAETPLKEPDPRRSYLLRVAGVSMIWETWWRGSFLLALALSGQWASGLLGYHDTSTPCSPYAVSCYLVVFFFFL